MNIRISQFITMIATTVALAASIGCLIQVRSLSGRIDVMATVMTAMQRNLAAAACHDCRARPVVMEVRR